MKIQKPAVSHHFVSRFYLKGFTENSNFIAYDLKNKNIKKLHTNALKNFCAINHFNTINDDNYEPDFIEKKLCLLEKEAKACIDNIENTKNFSGKDRAIILELMALFFIRRAERRDSFNSSMKQVWKVMLDQTAKLPVGGRVNGYEISEELYQALQLRDNFEVTYDKTSLIRMEFKALDEMVRLLDARKWFLFVAPEDSNFVTSDNPVVLIWKDKDIKSPPGLACIDTQVFFTVSKKIALVGDFEGGDEMMLATEENMALINSNIRAFANLWVFSPDSNFYHFNKNSEIVKNNGEFF